jgi:hypothetical protein
MYRIKSDGSGKRKISGTSGAASICSSYQGMVYFTDESRAVYEVAADGSEKSIIGYTWDVPITNWASWNIDPNMIGSEIGSEKEFVPLYKTADYLLNYETPGFRLASLHDGDIEFQIKSVMSTAQMEEVKNKAGELSYIYPEAIYILGKAVQARVAVGIKNADSAFLDDVLGYISQSIPIRPTVVIFTTLEQGRFVKIDSIGYITDSSQSVKKLSSDYWSGYSGKLSREMSGQYKLWDSYSKDFPKYFTDGMVKEGQSIYLWGFFSGSSNTEDSQSIETEMYAGEIGVYVPEYIDKEKRAALINQILSDAGSRYDRPWLNITILSCKQGVGDLIEREILSMAYKTPGDQGYSTIYNAD